MKEPCRSRPLLVQVSRSGGSKCWAEALSSNPNPLQCRPHHVESVKSSESSHHGALGIVLVRRADQQGAPHTCLQGPAERDAGDAGKKADAMQKASVLPTDRLMPLAAASLKRLTSS